MPQIGQKGFERVVDPHLQPFQMIQSLKPFMTYPYDDDVDPHDKTHPFFVSYQLI